MKKLTLVLLFAVVGTWVFADGPKTYDSSAMRDIMHSNAATYGAVSKAIDAGDWAAAADGFIQFAANAKRALGYLPPKGDPQEWKKIWTDFQFNAYKGVGAAGEGNADEAKEYLSDIAADRNKGHPAFKG